MILASANKQQKLRSPQIKSIINRLYFNTYGQAAAVNLLPQVKNVLKNRLKPDIALKSAKVEIQNNFNTEPLQERPTVS